MKRDLGIVSVRPFALEDLDALGEFCEEARALDAGIEPFAHRLGLIATGPRALLPLWRVAEGEDRVLYGLSFTALREARGEPAARGDRARSEGPRTTLEFYAAVHPRLRRQGLGRALCEAAVEFVLQSPEPAALRTRVRDSAEAAPGRAFLAALGFAETAAQLQLAWNGRSSPEEPQLPALKLRRATAADPKAAKDLQRLSDEAWAGAPDSFATRADEIAQLFGEQGRLVLIAESEGRAIGYLSGIWLGKTLGIEEVAVLPDFRRAGVGRALLCRALGQEKAAHAVLSVSEANKPARALYRSLGFSQAARRVILELRSPVAT